MTNSDYPWHGHLGIAIDTKDQQWDMSSFEYIINSISSCFRSEEIKRVSASEVEHMT
jgi:hypothetical protein